MMWTIAVAISSFAFTPITGSNASHNGLYSAFRNCGFYDTIHLALTLWLQELPDFKSADMNITCHSSVCEIQQKMDQSHTTANFIHNTRKFCTTIICILSLKISNHTCFNST
jgi:hypothetical protein